MIFFHKIKSTNVAGAVFELYKLNKYASKSPILQYGHSWESPSRKAEHSPAAKNVIDCELKQETLSRIVNSLQSADSFWQISRSLDSETA